MKEDWAEVDWSRSLFYDWDVSYVKLKIQVARHVITKAKDSNREDERTVTSHAPEGRARKNRT